MVVIWMPEALDTLEEIRKYIHENDAPRVASNFVLLMRKTSGLLGANPKMGKIEPLLTEDPLGYRSFVVKKRHKLIYYIDSASDTIYIDAVYDCRQKPSKLRRLLKRAIR